jgi:hypothetical protein
MPHLRVREPQHAQIGGGQLLVAYAIASLLGRCAVVPETVRFHYDAALSEEEVDAVPVQHHLRFGLGQARPRGERNEQLLELRVREHEGCAVDQPPKSPAAGLPSADERVTQGFEVGETELVGLVHGSFERLFFKHGREIDEGEHRARERDPCMPAFISIEPVAAVHGDAVVPRIPRARDGHVDRP